MATTTDSSSELADSVGTDDQPASTEPGERRRGPLPLRTIALGTAGSLLMMVSALGAGATLVHDPLIGRSPLSWVRYGHGLMLATIVIYLGFGMVVWAWVKLGRHVLAGR